MQPFISVIIPCFNVEQYIDRCLNSIITQTIGLDKLQLIIINDASTDGTYKKLLEWETNYPDSIILIDNESNMRQGTCRNIGMRYATGDYISFIDADDWIDIAMYERMTLVIKKYDCEIVSCKMSVDREYSNHFLSDSEITVSQKIIKTKKERCHFLFYATYSFTAMLYRREYLRKHNIHFLEDLIYEDKLFQELTYLTVSNICFLEENLYHYYFNPSSVSKSKNEQSHYDILKVIMSLWDEFEQRNYFENYREILEYRMLLDYYMIAMKIIMLRFDTFPYDLYYELKDYIHKKVPDYKSNPYIMESSIPNEWHQLWLKMLDLQMSEQQLQEIADLFKASLNV